MTSEISEDALSRLLAQLGERSARSSEHRQVQSRIVSLPVWCKEFAKPVQHQASWQTFRISPPNLVSAALHQDVSCPRISRSSVMTCSNLLRYTHTQKICKEPKGCLKATGIHSLIIRIRICIAAMPDSSSSRFPHSGRPQEAVRRKAPPNRVGYHTCRAAASKAVQIGMDLRLDRNREHWWMGTTWHTIAQPNSQLSMKQERLRTYFVLTS